MRKGIVTADAAKGEVAIIRVDNLVCGIDTTRMKEINKLMKITRVHGAPDFIRGVTNLRGQIVTVIDLRLRFGFPPAEDASHQQIVVIHSDGEDIGLLVDRVEEVVAAAEQDMEPPPSNIGRVTGEYFESIFKMDNELVAILKTDVITRVEEQFDGAEVGAALE